ncbi:MAG: TetR/AcrR family transcriptional regulator [Bacteroidia bacterium]|nr:TetR/AcrR family transcriptional regulator [Bacteroidia bacterium]
MELDIHIKMNEKLFLRDPYQSALGRKIVSEGLKLINKIGFEEFTFKKLALTCKTTEASIYRYFENKHRLLVYIINWYWSYIEYKVIFSINNVNDSETKLKTIIRLLTIEPTITKTDFISELFAYKLVMYEGSKTYLTRNVTRDNKDRLFKPYKDLCARIAGIIKEYNPRYKFPASMASTILEMSHAQKFFKSNLPALTDAGSNDESIIIFLEHLLFTSIKASK